MPIRSVLEPAPEHPPAGELPCRTHDPDLWFAESPVDLEHAKALCHGCPVRTACLAGARRRGEPWGVWGAEIFDHGSVVAFKRPRGRPPKATRTVPREPAAG
ncbi:WhiB family transcriptional regulator, redox-sensing transcriptional regulator [Pseudonocardia ammonioxydans]|uniref:Transcriptional regulator WhiB n=1 Tax=Pseudonocardia ammonioxydans TaxID=260086 RepID=A0A1I5CCV0_PSUAM|nr:WhiB family transcriptional regulator [Pseudonocardia ammonioxydans]SFN84632.1 WhiB family transcriptional regulator, redox-sensing transcriptional regulator [Pseudonocardia ammonioxydans]